MHDSLHRLSHLCSDNFKETNKYNTNSKLDVITQKGKYPYGYINSRERFNEKDYLLRNISSTN